MARGDGIDRTNARNMRLTETKIGNTQQHNEREKDSYVNQDIVLERTPLNVHFKTPSAGYREMFAQMEADGVISTRGIKEDAFRYGELVFDVNSAYFYNHGGYDFAKQFYTEAYKAAIKIVGGEQYILSAVMHADERNRAMSEALGEDVYHYHLHVVYIPVVEKEIRWTKRCKDKSLVGKVKETIMQVSMSKKWASKPILDETTGEPLRTAKGKPVLRKSYSVLQDDFFEHMRSAGYDDVERGERGSSEEHLTVTQFKTEREQERLAQLQEVSALAQVEADKKNKEAASAEKKAAQARAKLDDVAPLLKGMEKLAADFSDDPERTLPEAGPLESAKSYREKKAKPLWEKIVKVLRSVYRAYFDLKSKFERLQSAYDREVSKNGSLSARIYEVCADEDIALYKQIFFCLSGLRRCPGHDRALLPGHKVLGAAAVRQAQFHSLLQQLRHGRLLGGRLPAVSLQVLQPLLVGHALFLLIVWAICPYDVFLMPPAAHHRPAVVLAGTAGVAVNGGDVGPIPALTDANMTGGALAGEVEEHDVSRPVVSHRLLLVEGHQRGTVGGLSAAVVQLGSPGLPEHPPDEHGAPGVFSGHLPPIVDGVILHVVTVGRGFSGPDLRPGDLQYLFSGCHSAPPHFCALIHPACSISCTSLS